VASQDLVLIKRRFGALILGPSDLHARLQERGIDTLIVSGTLS
jgi:ureidoacrylate peracid hydrolase